MRQIPELTLSAGSVARRCAFCIRPLALLSNQACQPRTVRAFAPAPTLIFAASTGSADRYRAAPPECAQSKAARHVGAADVQGVNSIPCACSTPPHRASAISRFSGLSLDEFCWPDSARYSYAVAMACLEWLISPQPEGCGVARSCCHPLGMVDRSAADARRVYNYANISARRGNQVPRQRSTDNDLVRTDCEMANALRAPTRDVCCEFRFIR
jgi:hypothetical protein